MRSRSSRCGSAGEGLDIVSVRFCSLALLSRLRIRCCHELQCRSQRQLGSAVAVAVAVVEAGSYSSDSAPSLETSICLGRCGSKKKRKKKKKRSDV